MKNVVEPLSDFYIHDVRFEDLSDNPRFDFEFALKEPDKKKAPYFEASLKLKAKQLFKKIEEIRLKNEATFAYPLFKEYPDKVSENWAMQVTGYTMPTISARTWNPPAAWLICILKNLPTVGSTLAILKY